MTAPPPSSPFSAVELTISCRKLKNLDVASKSDPCCIVYLKRPGTGDWIDVGKTETIYDSLNPTFSKKINMTYFFEERQLLRFDVYDIDSTSSSLNEQDFIGTVEAALGEIVSFSGMSGFERPLRGRGKEDRGFIKIVAEELGSCKEAYTMKFGAGNLPTAMLGGQKSFFLEIHKAMEGQGDLLVYRGPAVAGKKVVTWLPFQLNAHTLCNGDLDRTLRLSVWKHKSNGSHKMLGSCNTNVRALLQGQGNTYNLSGCSSNLRLESISKDSQTTFLDFVKVGVQLHCFVGVDFTASNGSPTSPSSLHYFNPSGPNQYQMALRSVLDIIQDYDSDKMFPALGFGAQVPPDWHTDHCFFLNGHESNPYCSGVEGVMQAYGTALQRVRLNGPTNFAPIINHVASFAHANQDGRAYFILLILTDGVISDMAQTTEAIVNSSSLPMSIIIVGVGQTDFSAMETLDADDRPLRTANGRRMERDIVQFVPFSRILSRTGNNWGMAQVELAREVLAEIPRQFLSYMKKVGVTPEKLQASAPPPSH